MSNGDNDYDPSFLSVLAEQQGAEVVVFDYYSRFQRPTGLCQPEHHMPLLHRVPLRPVIPQAPAAPWLQRLLTNQSASH